MKNRQINNLYNIDALTKTDSERAELFNLAVKKIFITAGIVIFTLSLSIMLYIFAILRELPDVSLFDTYSSEQSTQIFDKNNNLITNIYGDEDRISVPLQKISPYLRQAVVSVEDNRFYKHSGIDLMGTIRAFYNNILNRDSIQGGSTITQQLVKNFFLTPQRSFKRKIMEAVLSVKLEMKYSKEEILEKYLNQIYWGNLSYGIEKASIKYFNKPAKNLNLSESSMLAGLITAPELYSPYINIKQAKERQMIVLDKMLEFGYITKQQKYSAYAGSLKLVPRKFSYSKYIYFVDYVCYQLRQKYGDNIVRRGGLKVYTTLDPKIQQIAEKTMEEGIKSLPKGCGVKEGALVSIDVKTNYVQAVVGGIDFAKSQYNRAVLAKRPVGSGFKPVVYLTGLRLGVIKPDSIIYDSPVSYRTKWNVWYPHNWDGKYLGKMTITQALTLSRNTPTVRIALMVGVDKIIETARLLGIKSYIRRGFSMVLGSSEITPIEVATLYTTLARDGVYSEPISIRYISDFKGNIIETFDNNPIRVINSEYVRQLNAILVNVVENGTGKSAKIKGRQVAGKTGTTDSVKDIWFSGFTPDTETTIWMGNDENRELSGVFSSNCAVLWNKFMTEYYKIKTVPAETFPVSELERKKQEMTKLKKDEKDEKDKNKTDKQNKKSLNKMRLRPPVKKKNRYRQNDENVVKKPVIKQKNTKEDTDEPEEYAQQAIPVPKTYIPPRTYIPENNNAENKIPPQEPVQNYQQTQENYALPKNYNIPSPN